jgi:hypothetical protein
MHARIRGSPAGSRRNARHEDWARLLAGGRIGRALVCGVGVGIDENDGERLGAARQQVPRRRRHRVARSTAVQDRAVGQRPFRQPRSAFRALGHGREITPETPGVRSVAAAHLQRVAKAARGDEAELRALALKQRVGADRGAMHDGTENSAIGPSRFSPSRKPTASSPRFDGALAVRKLRDRFIEEARGP